MSVVVTGLGAVSALGVGIPALRAAIFAGRHGIRPVTRFDVTPFAPVHLGGCVEAPGTCFDWALAAAREAWEDAGCPDVSPRRLAIVAGTTEGEAHDIVGVARVVAAALGAEGPRLTVSTACTSSANAIGLGRDLLARGDADVVVAGGAEQLFAEMYAGFHRLGVLAEAPCAPFGDTRGTTLGEGAGFVVLEREREGARARIHGYGLASDAWHETSPEPRGAGIARAVRGALSDAALEVNDIDHVSAHATGTAANDDAEHRGLRAALGARVDALPISGSKSQLGHAQGAAGVLELFASLVCMREGAVPPTLRVGGGRPGGPADPVRGERPRPHAVRHALASSSAFGGANAVLAFGPEPRAADTPSRPIYLTGRAHVGFGAGAPRDESALEADVDLRQSDPATRLALAATRAALEDAGVRIRGALRERAGIFCGAAFVSPESAERFRESVERGGLARASAPAFARLVLHAPGGAVSRLLALRGPTTTLCDPGLGGLLAFGYASDHLARRRDADVMVACGWRERRAEDEAEGASALVLEHEPRGPASQRVAGVAFGGPDDATDTVARALVAAELSKPVETVVAPDGCVESLAPLLAASLAPGCARLIVGSSPHASCAVVLVSV